MRSQGFRDLLNAGSGLFFRPLRLDAGNRALQPMLHVLPQLLFRLLRLGDGIPLFIQWDVMTRDILGAVLLGHEIVKQTLMASVRTRRVAVVGAHQRILENGSRSPRGAIPISIAPLLDEVKLIP